MLTHRPVTVIVEPNPDGHRFQAVANVAAVAARTDNVLLLTSRGAQQRHEFSEYLSGRAIHTVERFTGTAPSTPALAHAINVLCRETRVDRVVVTEADQALKLWWWYGPGALRGAIVRPRVVFALVRYPTRLKLSDLAGQRLRLAKVACAWLAMALGCLHRVAVFAGRDDLARGWLVHRARDPQICTAHSRDREEIRARFRLPVQRRLVGILGAINMGKNAPMVTDAILLGEPDTDLLLAGALAADMKEWLATLPAATRKRLIVIDRYLSNDELDALVAASDVVAIVQDRNAPSGIMGKALAAAVPVVSAGSVIRAREIAAHHSGVDAEYSAVGVSAALDRLRAFGPVGADGVPAATDTEFGEAVLGTQTGPTHGTATGMP